ncbi:hypothetical protein M2281_001458 [Mesorhizobium soli]|jgi:hypothetical protein|nr:hypothetical protein [Mesorhizobium soli]MDH6230886.1 hypothetical protein [Mesorhizobium soli]
MIRIWLKEIAEVLRDAIRLLTLMRSAANWDPREKGRPPRDFDER